MNKTQHDLSYNSTKLDYMALLRTSQIAFTHTRNELDRYLHQTYELKPALSYDYLAGLIAQEAEQLVVAAETMHTLKEGLNREELEIVNKPEAKESV